MIDLTHGRWQMASVLAFGCACGSAGTEDLPSGTVRMVMRLDSIAHSVDSQPTQYANRARVAALRDRASGPDLRSELLQRAELALQLLLSGENRQAIEEFQNIQQIVKNASETVPAEFIVAIDDNLAMAHLRMGQQDHCPTQGGSDACSFPIDTRGSNENRGARNAVEAYETILRNQPQNTEARWLLNVAYMMLGEYPEEVPPHLLIPDNGFGSGYDVKQFSDVAPQLGLDVIGLAGGSVADDFDGDGYLDIMASSWGLRDQTRFFRNRGDGSFEDRTWAAGLTGIVGGLNMVQADYNNDGFPDVLILRGAWLRHGHPNSLLRSNGNGTFTDVTEEAGLLEARPTQTAVWGDFDNDGWIDLFVGNESIEPVRNPSRLFRNNGDGTFSDIAQQAGVAVIGFVKGVTAGDYDNDGRLDLYVSRLREPNLLFHNTGDDGSGTPSFVEVAGEAGVQEPVYSFPTWFFDYDNDGWQDLFVSGFFATSGDVAAEFLGEAHNGVLPHLYRNNGDGTFSDQTVAARLNKVMLTMGSNFGDLDNDGFLDFFVGTGNPDLQAFMPSRMFRNAGGAFFQEVTSSGGFGHLHKGHGVSFADFDNDGDQDIHHVVGGAYEGDAFQNALYVNPGHANRWITLRLEGVESNRAAIGTRIELRVGAPDGDRSIHTTVTTGGSFGANSLQQEIGLGNATVIRRISITWPATGRTDVYRNVSMDQVLHIQEGAANPTPVTLNTFDLAQPNLAR